MSTYQLIYSKSSIIYTQHVSISHLETKKTIFDDLILIKANPTFKVTLKIFSGK